VTQTHISLNMFQFRNGFRLRFWIPIALRKNLLEFE
jgi:hypothetical protein